MLAIVFFTYHRVPSTPELCFASCMYLSRSESSNLCAKVLAAMIGTNYVGHM